MMREAFMQNRVLFTIDRCAKCHLYKEFIERLNLNLPIEKRIINIDCTSYENFGVPHPLIKLYGKYIKGYPTLFWEGAKMEGANSKEELIASLKVLTSDDVEIPEELISEYESGYLELTYNKECKFEESRLNDWVLNIFGGKKISCVE